MLTAVLMFCLPTAQPLTVPDGYRVIVEQDFSTGAPGWGAIRLSGGAALVDGEILVPVTTLSDAVVDYRARVHPGGILNLRFRYDLDRFVFYMLRLDTRTSGGNSPGFLKRDATEQWWHTCGERLTDKPAPADQWLNVRLTIKGSRFEAFIDGDLVATLEDPDYKSGFLAFNNELAPASVAWVRVAVPEESKARPLGIAPPAIRDPEPFTRGQWTAEWIWLPADEDSLVAYFRRTFDLPADPGEAILAVTCDNRYEVWINNKRVGADSDWYSVETYDVTRFLTKGRNIIAVIGENEEPGAAGLLAELAVNCVDGSYVNVHTDATWRVSTKGLNRWSEADFDDSQWPTAASLGPHPRDPWASQSPLEIPYLGAKQPLKIVSVKAPQQIGVNKPFALQVTFLPPQPLKADYPIEVLLRKADIDTRVALLKPSIPPSQWAPDTPHIEDLTVTITPSAAYMISTGPCEVQVRLLGTFLVGAHVPAHVVLTRGIAERFVGLRKPSPDGNPVTAGNLFDTAGQKHPWRLNADGSFSIDDTDYAVIPDSSGVYFCRLDAAARRALADLDWPTEARRLCADGGPVPEDIVRVRLVDHVDCTREDHEFSEDGGLGGASRVLKLGDRKYRVTAARKRTSYFAYSLHCDAPRDAHLLAFQTPNDRERYTTVRIQPPWDNVGGGVYTGREYPCDNRALTSMFLFYPRKHDVRLTVSSIYSYEDFDELKGAAVSNLWLFALEDTLADRPVTILKPDSEQRKLGLYLTHPAYCYQLYGFNGRDEATRQASMTSFSDYLGFCGINLFEFNAVDGGDTTSRAYYPSRLWPAAQAELLEELLTHIAPTGVSIVPIITSLSVPEGKLGFTKDSFLVDRAGKPTYFFGGRPPLPDPLRPEAQKALLDTLEEILEACADNPAVPAVGFRVNGKIGLCWGGSQLGASDQYTGYSEWDVEQFRKATGIDVPAGLEPTAYEWIRANCWDRWLQWRCEETAKLWRKARDLVRSYRPDLLLMASCDMPSETPAWNIYWPEGNTPLQCMIYHGVDPRMFRDEQGILMQRGMMVSADRYFTHQGQYGTNHWALKAFHYARGGPGEPDVASMYDGPHGAWCELYHNYWEESGIFPQGEFRTEFWGAATMAPWGRYFFEPVAFSLHNTNAYAINLFSWERGTFSREHDLRSFARAFRAIPMEPGEDFTPHVRLIKPTSLTATGTRAADKPEPAREPEGESLWARWFGDRLALCNFSPQQVVVEVTWPTALKMGEELVEASRLTLLRRQPGKAVKIELSLAPYELLTVVQRKTPS